MSKTRPRLAGEVIHGKGFRIRARVADAGVNGPSQLSLTLEVKGLAVDLTLDADAAARLAAIAAEARTCRVGEHQAA